jgi:hypothetical protein
MITEEIDRKVIGADEDSQVVCQNVVVGFVSLSLWERAGVRV